MRVCNDFEIERYRSKNSRTIQVFVLCKESVNHKKPAGGWLVNETLVARIANKLRHYNLEVAS